MFHFLHRTGAIVLTLGALALTPAISLAGNFESSGGGHRIYQGEGLPRTNVADYAQIDVSGHRIHQGEGLPRINVVLDYAQRDDVDGRRAYLGEGLPRVNVALDNARYQQVGDVAMQPSYHDAGEPWLGVAGSTTDEGTAHAVGGADTTLDTIKQLFGTEHVTQAMIEFYEDNFWEFEDYAPFANVDDDMLPGADDTGRYPAGRFDY